MKRENWHPTEHTWLCSEHFICKHKSENPPVRPDYVPSVFEYVGSCNKSVAVFERRMHARLKREEALVTACMHMYSKKITSLLLKNCFVWNVNRKVKGTLVNGHVLLGNVYCLIQHQSDQYFISPDSISTMIILSSPSHCSK